MSWEIGSKPASDHWSGISLPSGFRRKGGEVGAGSGKSTNGPTDVCNARIPQNLRLFPEQKHQQNHQNQG